MVGIKTAALTLTVAPQMSLAKLNLPIGKYTAQHCRLPRSGQQSSRGILTNLAHGSLCRQSVPLKAPHGLHFAWLAGHNQLCSTQASTEVIQSTTNLIIQKSQRNQCDQAATSVQLHSASFGGCSGCCASNIEFSETYSAVQSQLLLILPGT